MEKTLNLLSGLFFDENWILFSQNPTNLELFSLIFINFNLLILIALGINQLFSNLDNMDKVMGSMMIALVFSIVIVKYLAIFWNREGIAKVKSLQKNSQSFLKFHRMFMTITIGTIIANLGFMTWNLAHGMQTFTMPLKFPFDVFSNGLFPFALCWAHGIQSLALLLNCKMDLLTYKMIFNASMEFRKLKDEFSKLKTKKNEGKFKKVRSNQAKLDEIERKVAQQLHPSTSSSFNLLSKHPPPPPPPISNEDLLFLLKRHCQLLELANCLKDICKVPFTYNFAINSFIICSIAFCMSVGQFSFFILIIGFLFNIQRSFMQSFFAQLLSDSSEEVANGIYDCGWEDFEDENCKKLIQLALMRAQKQETFVVFNIWEVNLEQYLSVSKKCKENYALKN